jgi:hypothetical protein
LNDKKNKERKIENQCRCPKQNFRNSEIKVIIIFFLLIIVDEIIKQCEGYEFEPEQLHKNRKTILPE